MQTQSSFISITITETLLRYLKCIHNKKLDQEVNWITKLFHLTIKLFCRSINPGCTWLWAHSCPTLAPLCRLECLRRTYRPFALKVNSALYIFAVVLLILPVMLHGLMLWCVDSWGASLCHHSTYHQVLVLRFKNQNLSVITSFVLLTGEQPEDRPFVTQQR